MNPMQGDYEAINGAIFRLDEYHPGQGWLPHPVYYSLETGLMLRQGYVGMNLTRERALAGGYRLVETYVPSGFVLPHPDAYWRLWFCEDQDYIYRIETRIVINGASQITNDPRIIPPFLLRHGDWWVGNFRALSDDLIPFSFTKTCDRLYNGHPWNFTPLTEWVRFALWRSNPANPHYPGGPQTFLRSGEASEHASGYVDMGYLTMAGLLAGRYYITESLVPRGFLRLYASGFDGTSGSPGHTHRMLWRLWWCETLQDIRIERVVRGLYPQLEILPHPDTYDCRFPDFMQIDGNWYLGNYGGVAVYVFKHDQQLYDTPRYYERLSGARFRVFRNATGVTPAPDELVQFEQEQPLITAQPNDRWVEVSVNTLNFPSGTPFHGGFNF